MPFNPAPASATFHDFAFRCRTQPCFGETENGDGCFLESDRRDGRSLLLLVDVMHHGPQAALLVYHLAQQLLPQSTAQNLPPGELLRLLHSWLLPVCLVQDEQRSFVCALCVLVTQQGELVGSLAAQPSPVRRTLPPGGVTWELPGDAPLGAMWSLERFADVTLVVPPGEGLLACTDGVPDTGTPSFGTVLNAFVGADPGGPGLLDRLFVALQTHAGHPWPADDTTAFWLERATQTGSP